MPDLQNFSVTPGTAANVNIQRFTIECQITDSNTGAVLHDFTGANAIQWPSVMGTLTAAQRRSILQDIVNRIIYMRAGLETDNA